MLTPASADRSQPFSTAFPSVTGLPSRTSAASWGHAALFGPFSGTMPMSDSSEACMSGLQPQVFPDRPAVHPPAGASEVSRFSNIEYLRMLRVFRLRRAND